MRNEILKGIFVGLLCIVAVIGLGSFIGFSLSDYEPSPQAGGDSSDEAEGAPESAEAEI